MLCFALYFNFPQVSRNCPAFLLLSFTCPFTPLSPRHGPVASHCVPSPPCRYAQGFNVFITCLTRCLIASPLNGAVTVVTRNKRPPENEMIKQVTLAKQTAVPEADAAHVWGKILNWLGSVAGRVVVVQEGWQSSLPQAQQGQVYV